jgi:hypothetical protein
MDIGLFSIHDFRENRRWCGRTSVVKKKYLGVYRENW